jgi:hypothetical protein
MCMMMKGTQASIFLVGLKPVIQSFTWLDAVNTLNCMASLIGIIII